MFTNDNIVETNEIMREHREEARGRKVEKNLGEAIDVSFSKSRQALSNEPSIAPISVGTREDPTSRGRPLERVSKSRAQAPGAPLPKQKHPLRRNDKGVLVPDPDAVKTAYSSLRV